MTREKNAQRDTSSLRITFLSSPIKLPLKKPVIHSEIKQGDSIMELYVPVPVHALKRHVKKSFCSLVVSKRATNLQWNFMVWIHRLVTWSSKDHRQLNQSGYDEFRNFMTA